MKKKSTLRMGMGALALLLLMSPLSTAANECVSTFDPVTGILTVPCLHFEGTVYDIDLELIQVDLKNLSKEGDCTTNADCGKDEYCAKTEGDCDGVGSCTAEPEACYLILAPVVGCDGNTYSNDCVAAGSGVNVLGDSPCESSE